MKRVRHIKDVIILLIALMIGQPLFAQSGTAEGNPPTLGLEGQVIGWGILHPSSPSQINVGARYLPKLSFELPLGSLSLEGEASADILGSATLGGDSVNWENRLDPYRIWAKLSGDQFELRAGLQKINFGSANMIRPLMWFDQMDPKDPLQLTQGVYGILGRYYFLNNANIWLWGLYGNNELKGLEVIPTTRKTVELGGRLQLPLPIGEVAFTYHHRNADPGKTDLPGTIEGTRIPENRYALDFKIDAMVGLWFEGAIIQKQWDLQLPSTNTLLNAGADYTIGLGNGLNFVAEALWYQTGENPFDRSEEAVFAGLSLNYPISIIHNLSAILFLDPINGELYRFLNWSMAFDRWSFYTIGFWNPESYLLPGFDSGPTLFTGAGLQFMAVFNY